MFFEIWFIFAASCPKIEFKPLDMVLTPEVAAVVERAKIVCPHDYKKSPCPVLVEKVSEHNFHVVCGEKR